TSRFTSGTDTVRSLAQAAPGITPFPPCGEYGSGDKGFLHHDPLHDRVSPGDEFLIKRSIEMPGVERKADAIWHGNLKEGNGKINASSGVLKDVAYTYATRFEQAPGTNPEELIAAAQAACFSMALANNLSKKEYHVHHIQTQAIVSMA